MKAYRFQKVKYIDLNGIGSTFVEGRWNTPGGLAMIYTSSSESLALLEILAHLDRNSSSLPAHTLFEIEIPDVLVKVMTAADLPAGWNADGNYIPVIQKFGMDWLASNSSLAISVPSKISRDRNILINPQHDQYHHVSVIDRITPYPFDRRLFGA